MAEAQNENVQAEIIEKLESVFAEQPLRLVLRNAFSQMATR